MSRIALVLLGFISLQCGRIGPGGPVKLSYEVQYAEQQQLIDITGTLTQLERGTYYFILPRTQGQPLDHFVQDVRFFDGGQEVPYVLTDRNEWRVDIRSDSLQFAYRINPRRLEQYEDEAWGGAVTQADERMAFLSGSMSFIMPLIEAIEQPIHLTWQVPDSWHVVTPWSVDQPETIVPSHYGLVRNYYVVFKEGSILQRRIRSLDLSVVWLGDDDINKYTEAEYATRRVIDAALDFFGNDDPKTHLTLILRDSNASNRFRASTESNSIEFNFKRGITFERLWRDHKQGFLRLLAHEIMHTWDRREVKEASEYLSVREWGPNTCWLREGFTEYFAQLNLFKSEVFTAYEFVNMMHALSNAAHELNRERGMSLIEACAPFWSDRTSMQYVYAEGAVFAFWLDLETRRVSKGAKSLPLFMREYMEEYRYQEKTVESFINEWKQYAPPATASFTDRLSGIEPSNISGSLKALNAEFFQADGRIPEHWKVPETALFNMYFD